MQIGVSTQAYRVKSRDAFSSPIICSNWAANMAPERWKAMMRISTAVVLLAALEATLVSLSSPTHAEIEYAWCAVYKSDAGTNCGFVSFDQCLATISGIGGFCYPNPAYSEPDQRAPRSDSTQSRNR